MAGQTSIYSTAQSRNIVLLILILLTVFLFIFSAHILTALLSAAILYILFKPMFLYFVIKRHLSRGLSAALVIVISFLVIVLPLCGLSILIINKLAGFQDPEALKSIVDKIQHIAGPHVDLKDMLNKSINDISKWALAAFSIFLSGAVKTFISLIILYFTLFFMYKSYSEFENALLKYLPFGSENSKRFGTELKNMTFSNILGQGLIGLSQGIVVAIGFLIFGIPDPLFWGIVSIFVCFLPVVGAPIIFVPAGLIELSNGNTTAGIGILIWGAVLVTIIDNFLRQFISKKIADTHPLITIIGVVIGVPVFGIIGLVIGPFMISFLLLLFRMYEVTYLTHEEPKKDLLDSN